MPDLPADVTAEVMATRALDAIKACVKGKKPFVFEAGAGAGKTETLKRVLEALLDNEAAFFRTGGHRIACITYTRVAAAEIASRIKHDPRVRVSTIHNFAWEAIKSFQPQMRDALPNIPKWQERIDESGPINSKPVEYFDSFPRITDEIVEIGHSDVLWLLSHLLTQPKFRTLLADQFPYIFIDEYQDTDSGLIDSIKVNILNTGSAPLFGFFGDAWQKIYQGVCGGIEDLALERIPAQSNFRSATRIVDAMNRLRPELPQVPSRTDTPGEIIVYHTNDWPCERQTKSPWKGDLEHDTAQHALNVALTELETKGWDLSTEASRRLLLTHKLLGREQGYSTTTTDLSRDDFEDLKDPILAYVIKSLEPARRHFLKKQYGDMYQALGPRVRQPISPADKIEWAREMVILAGTCDASKIGDVLNLLKVSDRIPLSQDIERRMEAFAAWTPDDTKDDERLTRRMTKHGKIIDIPYAEMIALYEYHEQLTGFKTQHGVKGDEFPTVLVAFGGGWNLYNTNLFLEWFSDGVPTGKQDSYERMRNLFYVACSRAQDRLALLFTQQLSGAALNTLQMIFGDDQIQALPYTAPNA